MKILLIDPPLFRFLGENQPSPPLGPCYLASYLRKHGNYDVTIYNADFDPSQTLDECNKNYKGETDSFSRYRKQVTDPDHPVYREVISEIKSQDPDVIGVSIKTAKFFVSKTIIDLIKQWREGVPVITGGPHVSASPEHVLEHTRSDFCVIGEGEETFLDLIRHLESGAGSAEAVRGLAFRKGGGTLLTGRRRYIQNLDDIPFPAKDLVLNVRRLRPDQLGGLFSSRGCPFECSFCDSRNTWSRKVRRRSPKNIVDEIVYTRETYGTTFFSFSDDCFVTSKKQLYAILNELDLRGISRLPKSHFRWWCEMHARLVDEEMLSRMKEANCVAIAVGVESGSQKTLDRIRKKTDISTLKRAASLIKKSGIEFVCFAMIGFPWEREKDIRETVCLFKDLQPDSGNLSIVTPLPNTPLYNYCKERGLINYDENYLNCFHQRDRRFFSEHISEKESVRIIQESFGTTGEIIANSRLKKLRSHALVIFRELGIACTDFEIHQKYQRYELVIAGGPSLKGFEKAVADKMHDEFPQYLEISVKADKEESAFCYGRV